MFCAGLNNLAGCSSIPSHSTISRKWSIVKWKNCYKTIVGKNVPIQLITKLVNKKKFKIVLKIRNNIFVKDLTLFKGINVLVILKYIGKPRGSYS